VREQQGPDRSAGSGLPPSRRALIAAVAILVALGSIGISFAFSRSTGLATCARLAPGCRAKRLPDRTLTGRERSGALGSVDGRDLAGIISFDQALTDAWAFSRHEDATTVQVTLGSSDAWGGGQRLYYAIVWSGICGPAPGPTHLPGSSFAPPPSCSVTQLGTVIDARSGAFVVEGSG
jgi:hypothetical protein